MTVKDFVRRVVSEQWPILSVGACFVLGFILVMGGYWRRGAVVLAFGVGLGAALRAALSDEQAGLLVVRSKLIDVAMTASVSLAMLYITWTINPLGRR